MEIDSKVIDVFKDQLGILLLMEGSKDDVPKAGTRIKYKGKEKIVKQIVPGERKRVGLIIA